MNMKQFWRKLPLCDRLDWVPRFVYEDSTCFNPGERYKMSWRKRKKGCKMKAKKQGRILFFVSEENQYKADVIFLSSPVYDELEKNNWEIGKK